VRALAVVSGFGALSAANGRVAATLALVGAFVVFGAWCLNNAAAHRRRAR
jgi:hypothetical protein